MSGRRVESDDDYESSVSEEYKPTKKRRSSAKTTRPAKKKAKHASPPADDAKVIEADARASLHPSSRHVIQQVKPMRDALMVWYAGVHATRGMPWRKPFDPSWGKEQKAQRAYEVSGLDRVALLRMYPVRTHVWPPMFRCGYQRSCSSKLRLPPSSRIMIDGWPGELNLISPRSRELTMRS